MANDREYSDSVILPGVRLDFFDAWTPGKPRSEKDQADPTKWKFKAKVIFDKGSDADARAQAAMIQAAKKLWGDNYANMIRSLAKNSIALRNGDDNLDNSGAIRPNYAGMKFVSCATRRDTPPQVVGPRKVDGKWVNIGPDGRGYVDGKVLEKPPYTIVAPYRGCFVNLKVTFVASKSDGKDLPNQIYAKFEALQFLRDGEAFTGGGATSAEGFDEVGEVETAEAGASSDNLFG